VALSEKSALNSCANNHYVRSGWKAVQWRFQTRTQIVSFRNMDISSLEIAGSRCGTGSVKVEWNVRYWVNKVIGDGQTVSGLRTLRKKKM
jgi:intergrase/recombinase